MKFNHMAQEALCVGLQMLYPVTAYSASFSGMLSLASRYRDNPQVIVNRRASYPFSPIGELESVSITRDITGTEVRSYGTGVLISPCYVITNHHVVFGDDIRPIRGKDYTMKFRIGVGVTSDVAFLGNTVATPATWGNKGAANTNDWAILRLKTCVGGRLDTGWMEVSSKSAADLIGADVAVAGYAGDRGRGEMSLSVGKAVSIDPANNFLRHSASAVAGESGAAVMIRENGMLKLVGMHTLEFTDRDSDNNVFDIYTDDHTNEFITVSYIVSREDIKAMLDEDKARYIANPAADRLHQSITAFPSF